MKRNNTTLLAMTNSNTDDHQEDQKTNNKTGKPYDILLGLNYAFLFVGSISSSLLSKYYFIHGGSSKWISTWVQTAGFPLLLPPIYAPYYLLKCTDRQPFSSFTPRILILSILVGLMLGLNNLLFSWGNAYLPVSTSSLLLSSQLVFNLILSVIIVKQKITFVNLNCVILLTLSSVLVGIDSDHNRPVGLTQFKYYIGFFCTIAAGLMFALYLPVMEKIYQRVNCYSMVMEMQLVMEFAATVLATVGMPSDGGFNDLKTESDRVFDKGPGLYWVTVVFNVVTWQICFMGTAGMVYLTSSLTGGICSTAILGMNVLGGVFVYREPLGGIKAVATVVCLWGFCSYVYGMYVEMKKEEEEEERVREIENKNNLEMEMEMEMAGHTTSAGIV